MYEEIVNKIQSTAIHNSPTVLRVETDGGKPTFFIRYDGYHLRISEAATIFDSPPQIHWFGPIDDDPDRPVIAFMGRILGVEVQVHFLLPGAEGSGWFEDGFR